jgi:hypothetical protein
MRLTSTALTALTLVVALAPLASAQSSDITLRRDLTQADFQTLVSDLGPILRFRQIGDTATIGKGAVDLGVQFANAPTDAARRSWSLSFPRLGARVGVTDRVDVGVWGGINANSNYGLVGFETKVALMTQGAAWPVSVSVRPSITALIGPSDLWGANLSVDLSVSRAFGAFAPYAGVAASTTGALEMSDALDLDPVSAGDTMGYVGLAYRWRALSLAAEVEKADQVRYGFRVGTRF